MRPLLRFALIIFTNAAFVGCEKRTAKFHPGDRVRVKLTDTHGIILYRLSPFQDDLYYLRVPGAPEELDKTWDWSRFKPYQRQTHLEGPYYDADLEAKR